MSGPRKRVVAFISGGGSNMLALAKACEAADYPAEIVAVFSDKPEAGGLAKAEALGIPTRVFERKAYGSKAEHEAAILAALAEIDGDVRVIRNIFSHYFALNLTYFSRVSHANLT